MGGNIQFADMSLRAFVSAWNGCMLERERGCSRTPPMMMEWVLFILSVALGARLMASLVNVLVHLGSLLLVFTLIFALADPQGFAYARQALGQHVEAWIHPPIPVYVR